MNRCVLDTDILSEVLKAKNPKVAGRAAAYQAEFGRLSISAVTVMEVVKGLHKMQRVDALEGFLSRLKAT